MTTTLITGANKGLGYETARRLIEAGHEVWVGARDPERGEKAAAELGARFVQLDVTSDESVATAAATVGEIDVLVNNAGIARGRYDGTDTVEDLQRVYETNVYGPVRVFHAFLPALRRSTNPVVVNVSSGLGSVTRVFDPSTDEGKVITVAYASSKSALNMISAQWSKAFPEIRINIADPGYTATDLNGNSGHQTVTEGTDAIVALATVAQDGPTGTYVDRRGVVPW
jgi:NAD(P)-dependent dehydrogenase (short-subunit alcohol dehydrogenase family)